MVPLYSFKVLHSTMTKVVKILLSDVEYFEIEKMIKSGIGRNKADFVKTATTLYIEKNRDKSTSS